MSWRKFFTKEIIKPFPVPEYIIFNVTNFNNWFNDKNNGATYAHSGIYLRLDKLSESHITEYIEKCYGIVDLKDTFYWSKPVSELIRIFHERIRERWRKDLSDSEDLKK